MVAALCQRSPVDYENGQGQTVEHTGQTSSPDWFNADYSPSATHRADIGAVLYGNDFTANSYSQDIDSQASLAVEGSSPSR